MIAVSSFRPLVSKTDGTPFQPDENRSIWSSKIACPNSTSLLDDPDDMPVVEPTSSTSETAPTLTTSPTTIDGDFRSIRGELADAVAASRAAPRRRRTWDWDTHRAQITRLYRDDRKSLQEVMLIMRREHGITAR